MYKFIDTNKVSGSAVLPSEALRINGNYIENLIPGYRTLSVSGREALSPELSTFETGARNGSTLKSKRYPARKITVKYQIVSDSNGAFREAYNMLARILDVVDAELIFNDENDKYFIGTPCEIREVEPGRNAVIGEFSILCTDPFKYSIEEYVVNQNTPRGFVIEYNGTYKSSPILEAAFWDEDDTSADGESEKELTGAGDCGYVAFFDENENIIQLGDPEEIDGESKVESQTLINSSFTTSSKWGTAAKKHWKENVGMTSSSAVVQTGTVGLALASPQTSNTAYYMTAKDYGSGEKWHGPSITREIPADSNGHKGAKHFTFQFDLKMAIGTTKNQGEKEYGAFQCLVVNNTNGVKKIIAGFNVYKGSDGKKAKLRFYVNNNTQHTRDIDLSVNNKYFGCETNADIAKGIQRTVNTCIIEKIGDEIEFNIGGIKESFHVPAEGFYDLEATEITFTFSKWNTKKTLSYNGLSRAKFTKNNCLVWRDIPNKFSASDVVKADCSTGNIYLNNTSTPKLGSLANNWEDFCLKPGVNEIGISYSDWIPNGYTPSFKIRYREVFL